MTRFGLDSTAEVPAQVHHQVGSTVALRYLSRSDWKVVTAAEHSHYRMAGIDLVLVFEDDGRPDLHGYGGGKADAEFALKQAIEILGRPHLDLCLRFAADYDPAGRAELTDAYYDGVAAVIPRERCGPYGGLEVVARQAARGFGTLWQTYAWSAGRFDKRASVYQYSNGQTVGGHSVDFNHIFGHDFGQYDRRTPRPVDPHHYQRFPLGPFPWKGRELLERATVQEYDRLRAHPLLHRHRLGILRAELTDLADRIAFMVINDAKTHRRPRNWLIDDRGWRYRQLVSRAQGKGCPPGSR